MTGNFDTSKIDLRKKNLIIFLLYDSNRYYFEHGSESGSFTPAQLNTIKRTTLGKVLCDNGDNFSKVSARVMEIISNK